MGNTLLLPIAITTTRDEAPAITVSEHRNHDIEGNMPNSLGVLYYDPDIKCIVMVPSREGNGIVRVSDTMTGCSMDIAFTVTEATTGINIYEDNDMFKFYNKNGTEYDPEKADNDWSFVNAPEWGVNRDVPYLTNLSKGEEGAFTSPLIRWPRPLTSTSAARFRWTATIRALARRPASPPQAETPCPTLER